MTVREEKNVGCADGCLRLFDSDGAYDPLPGLSDGPGEGSPGQDGRTVCGV
jgi:hypothetical protein